MLNPPGRRKLLASPIRCPSHPLKMRGTFAGSPEVSGDAYRFRIRIVDDLKAFSFLGVAETDFGARLVPIEFPLDILKGIPGGGVSKEIVLQVFHLDLAPGHLFG